MVPEQEIEKESCYIIQTRSQHENAVEMALQRKRNAVMEKGEKCGCLMGRWQVRSA